MPWQVAARRAELDAGGIIGVTCAGHRLALYRLDDGYFATSDACPHQGAPLSDGCVVRGYVECPVHRALFDIRTGASDGSVTARAVRTYPVRVAGDDIQVEIDA